MRNQIWYELVDAKFAELYFSEYISRQRKYRNWIKIATLIFSSGGAMGWKIWEKEEFGLIALIIIAIIQIISLTENSFFLSDDELVKLGEIRSQYLEYFNKTEHLFIELENEIIDEKVAISRFYENRAFFTEIEKSLDQNRCKKSNQNIIDKVKIETDNYFQYRHN